MLFKPEMCEQILRGEKTQTRRVVNPRERIFISGPDYPPAVTAEGRMKWQVGRTYAVQPGRGKKSLGRIKLLSIRRERLQGISYRDAEAEGCRVSARHFIWGQSPQNRFKNLWGSINTKKGTRWTDDPAVWVLEFELAVGF